MQRLHCGDVPSPVDDARAMRLALDILSVVRARQRAALANMRALEGGPRPASASASAPCAILGWHALALLLQHEEPPNSHAGAGKHKAWQPPEVEAIHDEQIKLLILREIQQRRRDVSQKNQEQLQELQLLQQNQIQPLENQNYQQHQQQLQHLQAFHQQFYEQPQHAGNKPLQQQMQGHLELHLQQRQLQYIQAQLQLQLHHPELQSMQQLHLHQQFQQQLVHQQQMPDQQHLLRDQLLGHQQSYYYNDPSFWQLPYQQQNVDDRELLLLLLQQDQQLLQQQERQQQQKQQKDQQQETRPKKPRQQPAPDQHQQLQDPAEVLNETYSGRWPFGSFPPSPNPCGANWCIYCVELPKGLLPDEGN